VLRVTTIYANTAGASARYYTRYLADGDGPEGEGRWFGRQAAGLGLSGVVATEDLESLLSGRDPVTGRQLGRALADRYDTRGRLIPAVAGFDATFSAPKSMSVWWALTGDPGVVESHDVAVRAVLEHLERFGATTRVRRNGMRYHPDASGLVVATFGQATSREDDPQLHTHVVVSSKVQAPDGRWMALDACYLKRHQRALGGLYQSVLRAELTHRYGVAWGPIENGHAEIAGLPRELLETFSKRTAQVDAALGGKIDEFRDREGRDPSRWERAVLTREAAGDTRVAKTHAPTTDLSARWLDEAAEPGWTPNRVVTAMRSAAREARLRQPTVAVADILEALSARGSTWTRADVLKAICDLAPPVPSLSGRKWARALEQVCDRVLAGCTSLDPPELRGRVRASDSRSIWLAPSEPHLTHDRILAQEEHILAFALDAHERPTQPSLTLASHGLDACQTDAAVAVAGRDRLVLVVGPAGTGKTTALRRAVDDLHRQRRPVFGVAPTAKAAKVLRDETRMPADTVAKLFHEWRTGRPLASYRLSPGTTVVVDEAGMLGTGALDNLVGLAVSHDWRLVLVGDPRQLQAVGRGGMFDELCRTGRTHQLATIHRFRHSWERAASLQLRRGDPAALDAYIDHGRVTAGTFDQVVAEAARQWIDHTAAGRRVAVVAETNDHVDALNAAIQLARHRAGQLGHHAVPIAGGEIASVGDIVATRRNDRSLRTDRSEPLRNRDHWTVTDVGVDGSLTVSHLGGHGQVTLPVDYVRAHVRLGYAATAHGYEGDTLDISLAVATPATSHRALYVAATRGRQGNRLLVVADGPDHARDVLEQVLTNDRADIPATVQRQHLAAEVPGGRQPTGLRAAEEALTAARQALDTARQLAAPHVRPLAAAEDSLEAAEAELRASRAERECAPVWRRRGLGERVDDAAQVVEAARVQRDRAAHHAAPYLREIRSRAGDLHAAEQEASIARLQQRLDALTPAATVGVDRGGGVGIDPSTRGVGAIGAMW
jgi:conjugative relaxase-like TrwC/TraI family protein